MFQDLLNMIMLDPWWFGGSGLLLLLILLLFLISLIRNARTLFWFYGASVFVAVIYAFTVQWYPLFLEALVSYRSDWSMVFLVQNLSITSLITQFILYAILFSLLTIVLVVTLELWSLLTFRWQRMRIILERSFSEPWFVLLFTVMTLLMGLLWVFIFGSITFPVLSHLFALSVFVYLLQFFIRLVDNAFLHTPKLFVEYLYATGLAFIFCRFVGDWIGFAGLEQAVAKTFFLEQLFVFFLAILLLGYLATSFVRALFASTFFLEHFHRRTSLLLSWTSRFFLSARERSYAHQRMLTGMLLSLGLGYLYVLLAVREWFLTLVPVFFLGYFVLFYLLDRQDDMRVRGDLVDKRIESAVSKVFFS